MANTLSILLKHNNTIKNPPVNKPNPHLGLAVYNKPKFNPNDPSTFQHSTLFKKWQVDSNIYAKMAANPSPKKKGWFDFGLDNKP